MKYEILSDNQDGTARVKMTIEDHVLEQDFAIDNLDEDVKRGMAVFKSELDRNSGVPSVDPSTKPILVHTLPEMSSEDSDRPTPANTVDE